MSNTKKQVLAGVSGCGCLILVLFILPVLSIGFWYFRDSIPYNVIIPDKYAYLIPPTPTPEPGRTARELIFTGKVVDRDATNWPNNRLVVVYLKGEEVGRTFTTIGKNELSDEGVTDGYFAIKIPNTYQVPENRFDFSQLSITTDNATRNILGIKTTRSVQSVWFGDIVEGGLYEVPVPMKNVSYFIKIFATDKAYLPQEMLEAGSTRLTQDKEIVLSVDMAQEELSSTTRALIQGIRTDVSRQDIEINRISVPMDNCEGNSPTNQKYKNTQTFYHEYEVEANVGVDFPIPLKVLLMVELQGKYGFKKGEVHTEEFSYDLSAEPRTGVMYTVTFLETWETGTAIVDTGEEVLNVPYRVRVGVTRRLDSDKIACSAG